MVNKMTDEELVKKIHKIYVDCNNTFSADLQFSFSPFNIKDKEERIFYNYIANYYLQKRQEEVMKNEKY